MRRTTLVLVLAALVLAGCGSEGSGDLDSVKVSKSKNPAVTVPAGFSTSSTETRVVAEGSGEALKDGDTVKLNYVAVNGRTGKQFDNSFKAESPMTVPLTEGTVLAGFIKGLTGQKVGSRVLVAIAPKDGFAEGPAQEQAEQTLGVQADDTMLFLFDIVAKVPTEASGEAKDLPSDIPSITLEDDKPSGFKAGKDVKDPGTKSSSYVAIEGDGEKIADDATSVTAHYVGAVYPDGPVFDSSWAKGTPQPFQLAQLYPCWQEQVPGHTVGSRIVILCPPGTGGQTPPQGADEDDTLIFVVDLLDAS